MAMETNATNLTNVSSVQPTKPVSTESVVRKTGDSASGSKFQPQTNVNIKSAVKDITELLAKVSSTENMTENTLPQELQKLVQNMMKNTFSLDNTLARGMGSSMESQRFSLEQLTTLARMLTQMGAVAEQGKASPLPEALQTLLSNLKTLDGADGKLLDTVNLNKLAFELLDKKTVESLPVELQILLGNPSGQPAAALPAQKSETFAFLKQLVQYFMPAATEEEASLENSFGQKQPENSGFTANTTPSTSQSATDTGRGKNPLQGGQTTLPQENTGSASKQVDAKNLASTNMAGKSAGNAAAMAAGNEAKTQMLLQDGTELPQNTTAKGNSAPLPGQNAATLQNEESAPAASQNQQVSQDMNSQQSDGQQIGKNNLPAAANTANAFSAQVQPDDASSALGNGQKQENTEVPAGDAQKQENTGATAGNVQKQTELGSPGTSQKQANPSTGENLPNKPGSPEAGAVIPRNMNTGTGADAPKTTETDGSQPQLQTGGAQKQMQAENASLSGQTSAAKAAAGQSLPQNSQTPLPSGNLQNTEQTMDTLKSLATLLLKDETMSEQDTTLLKAFVNGKQQLLSEPEAKQLQLLIRLSEKNIPASIQQAAQKENLPNLPKLWSFVQLCDLADVKDMQAQQLKSAGKSISDFATVLRQSMPNENTTVENQRSLSFMMPLYMGENEKSYPTYVHVYDEKKKNNETGMEAKETWLRLCLLTENIGAVEMVFRLYEQQNLNIRLSFSDDTAVKSFADYIPEVKASMEDSSLVLTDLKVSAIGSKIL